MTLSSTMRLVPHGVAMHPLDVGVMKGGNNRSLGQRRSYLPHGPAPTVAKRQRARREIRFAFNKTRTRARDPRRARPYKVRRFTAWP